VLAITRDIVLLAAAVATRYDIKHQEVRTRSGIYSDALRTQAEHSAHLSTAWQRPEHSSTVLLFLGRYFIEMQPSTVGTYDTAVIV